MSSGLNPSTRIAINGMGRIGRTMLRLLHQKGASKNIIALNDIMPKENLIYLLKFDSIRGAFPGEIVSTTDGIRVDGHEILYSQQENIEDIPWRNHSIEITIEATGLFTQQAEASRHLALGTKKILLTTFSKDVPTTVLGVNHKVVSGSTKIISPGDCTINCVAPLINLIDRNYGLDSVHVNVIQAYTTRQELIDRPYKGLRRGRAAGHSIIPFEVNISPILESIFPALKGKIESMSTRVPVPCGAIADISVLLKKNADANAINTLIESASRNELKNISSVTFDPIVSTDVLNNSHSSTVDGSLTRVTDKHMKLMAWFDNEWGYASRLMDWLSLL
ncbi:type I glyceraldehyde-3-phosphate dehydrogenase [Cytophagales bacterium WSM2-2]|nr:type I glyceraldehyde-3-phosphate dehydrogenase [Cytophagales bacterium WSM2-2]